MQVETEMVLILARKRPGSSKQEQTESTITCAHKIESGFKMATTVPSKKAPNEIVSFIGHKNPLKRAVSTSSRDFARVAESIRGFPIGFENDIRRRAGHQSDSTWLDTHSQAIDVQSLVMLHDSAGFPRYTLHPLFPNSKRDHVVLVGSNGRPKNCGVIYSLRLATRSGLRHPDKLIDSINITDAGLFFQASMPSPIPKEVKHLIGPMVIHLDTNKLFVLYQPNGWAKISAAPPIKPRDPAIVYRETRNDWRVLAIWGSDGAIVQEFVTKD